MDGEHSNQTPRQQSYLDQVAFKSNSDAKSVHTTNQAQTRKMNNMGLAVFRDRQHRNSCFRRGDDDDPEGG